ncbi:MAG: SH3 domain-containing protein [Clostridiales bacterium]|nr:SH3 domain-containing protein [Clostridiales bacterium]
MNKLTRATLSVMFSLMLAFSAVPAAHAQESIAAESAAHEDITHAIVAYHYAYDPSGSVNLYGKGGYACIGTLDSGSYVAVTDAQEDGRTFVVFGSKSGWVRSSDLYAEMPQDIQPRNQQVQLYLTPVPGEETDLIPVYTDSSAAAKLCALPVGTPVTVHQQENGLLRITYSTWEGWVYASNLSQHTPQQSADQANQTEITEQATTTESLPFSSASDSPSAEESNSIPDEGDTAPQQTGAEEGEENGDHYPIPAEFQDGADEEAAAVQVVQLGVYQSVILMDGERMEVPTAQLTFGEDVAEDQRIAYVHAPRTGKVTLRETPASNGKLLSRPSAGRIVAVLQVDETYSLVNLQGVKGYIRNDCLQFLNPDFSAAEDTAYPASGLLSCEGQTDAATSVNLRNAPTRDARKAAVWRTGTEVTVLAHSDGWYTVEADNILGYVMEEFLTLEE